MSQPTDVPRPDTMIITGAAGWLGQNLVRAVAPDRAAVRCLVRTAEEATLLSLVAPTVQTVVGDVRDPTALDGLFDGAAGATVVHAAAIIHPLKRVQELHDVNVGGTQLVLDRARRAGVTRFVHVSSNSPFGANPTPSDRFTEDSPFNPYLGYGKSKLEAEELVRRSHERGDVPAVIVRAPWFYGPFQPPRQTQFFAAIRRGRFPLVGDGTQRRSMAYTGNLVDGLLRAEVANIPNAGRAYWVADAEPYELSEILDGVRTALEAEGFTVSQRQLRIPAFAAVWAERADRLLQGRGRYVQPVHVLGELKDTIACDISRARAELGYEPRVSLVEGMRASIRWCLERGDQL